MLTRPAQVRWSSPTQCHHGCRVTFKMVEVAVSRQMFVDILSLIARLRALPAPA
jgi:hypothetical protein